MIPRSQPRRQSGFTLVAAVFVTTILALLSVYLMRLHVYQESAVALDTLGTRAYAASRAGAEWGAYEALRNNACGGTSLALAGTLAGFTATVTCLRTPYDEGGTTVEVFTIVSTGCNQPAAGSCPNLSPGAYYVERQVTMTVGR
jgi:MSHA biogenesis protein MshP